MKRLFRLLPKGLLCSLSLLLPLLLVEAAEAVEGMLYFQECRPEELLPLPLLLRVEAV
jgi:hypothetical protein